jgi:hypothetical protein
MRKFGLLATVALLAVVLLASGVGTAAAEPQKNQILVPVTCDNGQSYTLVINGMSKVGQISGGNQNLVVTEYTVTYRDSLTNEPLGEDTFDRGKAEESNGNSPQSDPIICDGEITTDLEGIGDDVTAVYEFEGFVTPRGK